MNKIIQSLINSYATLIMASRRTIENTPETYVLAGTTYQLRELVELEIAERTVNALDK